ncbi:MAG TPA: class I SAM-dependent methyltransferase [Chryseosolibacter sp.]
MERKDYFSSQSKAYAAFRPTYPAGLYKFIFKHLQGRSCAWDCATGNGQVARYLARHFENVYATDISQAQLEEAFRAKNIFYSVAPAEKTSFPAGQFDLITVAQALHWFNLDQFYQEVRRTGKPGGLLAVWGYALLAVDAVVDDLFIDFYVNTTGPYWDEARRLVENQYRDVPFPFERIPSPEFTLKVKWNVDQFCGYLNSWSAIHKYISMHGTNPVESFSETLKSVWKPGVVKEVTFPIFLKLGRISTQ